MYHIKAFVISFVVVEQSCDSDDASDFIHWILESDNEELRLVQKFVRALVISQGQEGNKANSIQKKVSLVV